MYNGPPVAVQTAGIAIGAVARTAGRVSALHCNACQLSFAMLMTHIHTHSLSLSLSIYIYICVCVCVYIGCHSWPGRAAQLGQ